MVLRNLPFDADNNPNPNLHYLLCPWLRRVLARLEDCGMIETLQSEINGDPSLYASVRQAQVCHAEEHRQAKAAASAGPAGKTRIPARMETSDDVFIAGAREPGLIKCLHAHFAYYLVHRDYSLGRRIESLALPIECPDNRCAAYQTEEEVTDEPGEGKPAL